VLAADFAFDALDVVGEELDGAAAFGADHVVMVAAVVLVLVARYAVVEGHLAGQPALGQQLERAVDSSETDSLIFLTHQSKQFIGGQVIASIQERAQNDVALAGVLEAHPPQMVMKNGLRFLHHLGRDSGLVINAVTRSFPVSFAVRAHAPGTSPFAR